MDINKSTVIFTIINFIILLIILRHFFFDKVKGILNARSEEIESTIRKTKEDEGKAKAYRLESENNLKESKSKGREIVEEFKAKADKLSDDMLKDAKEEAQTIIERAIKETHREKEKVEAELKEQAIDLAILLSTKALEESIDEQQHRKLIKDFIAKVGI